MQFCRSPRDETKHDVIRRVSAVSSVVRTEPSRLQDTQRLIRATSVLICCDQTSICLLLLLPQLGDEDAADCFLVFSVRRYVDCQIVSRLRLTRCLHFYCFVGHFYVKNYVAWHGMFLSLFVRYDACAHMCACVVMKRPPSFATICPLSLVQPSPLALVASSPPRLFFCVGECY